MPEPRPFHYRAGAHDDPPSTTSNPRVRLARLRRALDDTSDLAQDMADTDADADRRPRSTLTSPPSRRRRRSPSTTTEELRTIHDGAPSTAYNRYRQDQSLGKRRRLDEGTALPAPTKPIKYGHYGQVEPGRLKMHIISCDGGEHMDPRAPNTYLGVNNILQHDKSVYCSLREDSNIVLRHADNTLFCLEKLHIVGPEHGFTAPVQEGKVYVAMSLSDLKKYTDPPPWARRRRSALGHQPIGSASMLSRYNMSPPPRSAPAPRYGAQLTESPERITLTDALQDEQVNAAFETSRRSARGEDPLVTDAENPDDSYYGPNHRTEPEVHCDVPPLSSDDAPDVVLNPHGDHVPVTLLTDEDVGPEESSSQEVLDFRLRRLREQGRRLGYDREFLDGAEERYIYERRRAGNDVQGLRFAANANGSELDGNAQGRRHAYPSPRAAMPVGPIQPPKDEEGDDAKDDPNVTYAPFTIKEGKHKVAIKFEPAVSGRFILLKLAAGAGTRNVDVQSVIAKGFGGQRFFPARTFA